MTRDRQGGYSSGGPIAEALLAPLGRAPGAQTAEHPMCVCGHVEAHHRALHGGMFVVTESNRECFWRGCGCPTFVARDRAVASSEPTVNHCKRCDATFTGRAWKCCSSHVPDLGPEVVCEGCALELHPDIERNPEYHPQPVGRL